MQTTCVRLLGEDGEAEGRTMIDQPLTPAELNDLRYIDGMDATTIHPTIQPREMTKGGIYHITVKRAGRRRPYTYRFAEMATRDLSPDAGCGGWVAIWQHHTGKGTVLVASEIVKVVEL